ncbi:MAG TPA: response regulator [Roseiflexaceae bacterium]|nr:response regulator [Roseiflexaceae bacterium]
MPSDAIALIQQDAGVIQELEQLLREAGYRTRAFSTLDGTYEALLADPPDAIILGLHFPEQRHGLDLVTLLKLQPATRTIPVLLTSQDEPFIKASQQRVEQQHIPALWTITRPFNPADVLRILEQALQTGES